MLLLVPLATLALVATGVTAANAAPELSAGCRSVPHQLNFQEGITPVQIGFQKVTFRACWNSHGVITSSSAAQDVDTTPAGAALGYTIDPETIYPVGADSGSPSVSYEVPARGRMCFMKVVPVCGFWENFSTAVTFYSPGFVGPLPNNDNGATFYARCLNHTCAFEFDGNT